MGLSSRTWGPRDRGDHREGRVMPEPRRYRCRSCGHTPAWHRTESGHCAHDIFDEENNSWMQCGCPTLLVRIP